MGSATNLTLLAIGILSIVCWKLRKVGTRPKDYPPGPPTIPILGNLHQLKMNNSHLLFKEWAEKYGPIYTLRFGCQTMIFLNSDQAVKDLLDKRSALTSDRTDFFLAQYTGDMNMLMKNTDDVWRRLRKMYHLRLNATVANRYIPYMAFETVHLLNGILKNPTNYDAEVKRYTASVGSTMVFGWRTSSADDPTANQLFDWVAEQSVLATHWVFADWFPILRPILRTIPASWNPLMKAVESSNVNEYKLCYKLFNMVKGKLAQGKMRPCFTTDMLAASADKSDKDGLSEKEIAYNAGHAWAGTSDTSYATLLSFIKGMILFPDAQEKAHEEMDRVIGDERLPEWEDRESLPYIHCVVKESLRWIPPVPLGTVPHAMSRDEEYMGYKIPAGAGLINNVWAINNDENRTPDPRRFNPDRYNGDTAWSGESAASPDPSKRDHFNFGAGRRICPGLHIADRSLFLAIARLTWAFKFSRSLDANGVPVPIERDALNPGYVVSCPKFPCEIEVRSEKKAEFIREMHRESLRWLDQDDDYTEEFMASNFGEYK